MLPLGQLGELAEGLGQRGRGEDVDVRGSGGAGG
jgi:hypothetical protein